MYYYLVLHICLFFICSRDYDNPAITKAYKCTIRGYFLKIALLNEFIIEKSTQVVFDYNQ